MMFKILRFVFKITLLSLAVLSGNWVGGLLHFILTGKEVQTVQFTYTTAKGRQMTNAPVATKFYPGLLFALFGKPRWVFAFLGGILAGGLIPDRLEQSWLERVIEPLIIDRVVSETAS